MRPNYFKYFCDYTELTFMADKNRPQNGFSKENIVHLHMSGKSWISGLQKEESGEIPSSAEDQNKPNLQAKSNQSYSCTVPLPDKSVNWNRSYITFVFEFLHFLLNVLKAVSCINFTLLGCPKWPLRKLYFVNKTNLFNLGCPYNATRLLACFKIKSVRTEGI